jgi:hypothetical protein
MKAEKSLQIKGLLILYITPIILLLITREGILHVLNSEVVSTFLSSSIINNKLTLVGLLLLGLLSLIKPITRFVNYGWLSIKQSIVYIIIFLFFLIAYTGVPAFAALKLFSIELGILLMLFAVFPLFISVIVYLVHKEKSEPIQPEYSFLNDDALNGYDELSASQFLPFITELGKYVDNTSTENGSFTIGIVAPWGNGKTSFLNALKLQYSNSDRYEIIDLNVWESGDYSTIVENFIQRLKDKLDKYAFGFKHSLNDYAQKLVSNADNAWVNVVANFFRSVFSPSQNITDLKSDISDIIKSTNKKFIIYIDDLDRLTSEEILSVLKLVRNNFDFKNCYFLLAYDKEYINRQIEENNQKHANYIDKVVSVEFYLPFVSPRIIRSYFLSELIKINPECAEIKKLTDALFNDSWYIADSQHYSSFEDLFFTNIVKNYRDAKLFLNSFRLFYNKMRNELDVVEFFLTFIIRFKYYEIFMDLKYHKSKYFSGRFSSILNGKLDLIMVNDSKEEKEPLILEEHKSDNLLKGILDKLFVEKIDTLPHRSLRLFTYYDNYFSLASISFGLEEYKAAVFDVKRFEAFMEKYKTNEDAIEELKLHLENENDYTNKDEFMAFISNLFNYVNHYKESEIEDFQQSIYTCRYVSYERITPKFNIQNLRLRNIELTDEDFNTLFLINNTKAQYSDNLLIGLLNSFAAWKITDTSYANWLKFAGSIIKSRFIHLCQENNEYNIHIRLIRDQFVNDMFDQDKNFTNDILSNVIKNNIDNVIKLSYYRTGLPNDTPYSIDTGFLYRFFKGDNEIRELGRQQHSVLIDEFMWHLTELIKRGKHINKEDFKNQQLLKLVETYSYLKR